jgi:hypothetical protein
LFVECTGNKYEGGFKNDKKHGDGIAFNKADGSVWQQKWKNGTILSSFKLSDGIPSRLLSFTDYE